MNAVTIPAGFADLDSDYVLPLAGEDVPLEIHYDPVAGRLRALAVSNRASFIPFVGTWSVEGTGEPRVQRVTLVDDSKPALYTFEGALDAEGDLVGTYRQLAGFTGIAEASEGPLELRRSAPGTPATAFTLRFRARMDGKGRVRGAFVSATDDTETTATLDVFGGERLEGGRIRGTVRTTSDGTSSTTTASLVIKGRKWSVRLAGPITGPVSSEGVFDALADVRTPRFRLDDVPVRLRAPWRPQPPEPPGPDPEDKIRLQGGTATIDGNNVIQVRHGNVPKKFFGARADLTLQFPIGDGGSTVHATPETAATNPPRRLVVLVGGRPYSTQFTGSDVALEVRDVSVSTGGLVRVKIGREDGAASTVFSADGRQKTVLLVLEALVQ